MRIIIDTAAGIVETADGSVRHALGTAEGFALVSRAWLRAGWDAKHVYSFTWLGRPIIQLPEDVLRLQELVWRIAPDVIIETGVAHGGSLMLWATLLEVLGRGEVVGVDIEIRPHNRAALERHPLSRRIALIEGSSVAPAVVERVRARAAGRKVLVVLDSNHTRDHVLAELRAYAPMVSVGSYVVVMDGIMAEVEGAPRTAEDWSWNNPRAAAAAFSAEDPRFVLAPPPFAFNEGAVEAPVTYAPGGFLRRSS